MACLYGNSIKAHISGLVSDINNKDGAIWYKIQVEILDMYWFVERRYSDFEALNKKLVDSQGIPRDNVVLPPKKFIGNKDPEFVEKRRQQLDEYLKNVIQLLGQNPPEDLAQFLNLYDFEVIFMLRKLASEIFDKGEQILADQNAFTLSPYQIYAINERMKMPIPPLDSEDKRQDFSHIIEFCSRLEFLNIVGSNISLGNSTIVPNQYSMNLSIFRSLKVLSLKLVSADKIAEIGTVRQTVERLSIHNCTFQSMNQILLCDSVYKTFAESGLSYSWNNVISINCNNNTFEDVGDIGDLVPSLRCIELSYNKIRNVFNLTSLPQLERVSYSGNVIVSPVDLHLQFGNIVILDMSQNIIECLQAFHKLYSLVVLNLSCNKVSAVEQVKHISFLPCLESLILTGNPVASTVDYRVKALSYFGNRASTLELDNEKANSTEMDQISIIQAIELAKRSTAQIKN
ncbi:Nischarin [Orchesella cincta]|uniref:Nischarin n=1 Tax=Orchesella cincta TaxID=48709 RepID=A0A1D2MWG9_ORCCI|nr:Nischarin [Orchesella cincta]